jgi:hypothetical protein
VVAPNVRRRPSISMTVSGCATRTLLKHNIVLNWMVGVLN